MLGWHKPKGIPDTAVVVRLGEQAKEKLVAGLIYTGNGSICLQTKR